MPTIHRPIIWLDRIDVDQFDRDMRANFYSASKRCLTQAIFYTNEQAAVGESSSLHEAPSSTNSESYQDIPSAQETGMASNRQTVTKGFSPMFDSGASFSIIPETTLRRLGKTYTGKSNLNEDHRSRMTLVDVRGKSFVAVGIVSLLWYLDSFPSVLLNTTFYVVGEDIGNDLIIGRDVMQAAEDAVAQEKENRNTGPPNQLKRVANAVRSIGMLRHRSSGSLRKNASPRHSRLSKVDETAAIPNGSAG